MKLSSKGRNITGVDCVNVCAYLDRVFAVIVVMVTMVSSCKNFFIQRLLWVSLGTEMFCFFLDRFTLHRMF